MTTRPPNPGQPGSPEADPRQQVPDPLIPIPAATAQVPLGVEPGPAAEALTLIQTMLVTSGGLGLLRPASGTWGSVPPVALAGLMMFLGLGPAHGAGWSRTIIDAAAPAWWTYHAVLALVAIAGAAACLALGKRAEVTFRRKDPGQVVADETAAMCLVVMFLPERSVSTPLAAAVTLAGAFLAFRLFDILKLPPARASQRLGGGLGILVDDLIAAAQAILVVQLVTRLPVW